MLYGKWYYHCPFLTPYRIYIPFFMFHTTYLLCDLSSMVRQVSFDHGVHGVSLKVAGISYQDDAAGSQLLNTRPYATTNLTTGQEISQGECTICDLQLTHQSPGQNGRHFADDILRCIFVNENVCVLIENSLKFVPKDPIDTCNKPALV